MKTSILFLTFLFAFLLHPVSASAAYKKHPLIRHQVDSSSPHRAPIVKKVTTIKKVVVISKRKRAHESYAAHLAKAYAKMPPATFLVRGKVFKPVSAPAKTTISKTSVTTTTVVEKSKTPGVFKVIPPFCFAYGLQQAFSRSAHRVEQSIGQTAVNFSADIKSLCVGFGLATHFGGRHDKEDNGVGSSLCNPLSSSRGIPTGNVEGAACSTKLLEATFNIPPIPPHFGYAYWKLWEPVRRSALKIYKVYKIRGKTEEKLIDVCHHVDIKGNGGSAIDLTLPESRKFGGDGLCRFEIVPNYYPADGQSIASALKKAAKPSGHYASTSRK